MTPADHITSFIISLKNYMGPLTTILIFFLGIVFERLEKNPHSIMQFSSEKKLKSKSTHIFLLLKVLMAILVVQAIASLYVILSGAPNQFTGLDYISQISALVLYGMVIYDYKKNDKWWLIKLPHYVRNSTDYYIAQELNNGYVVVIKKDYLNTKKFYIKSMDDIKDYGPLDFKKIVIK